MQFMLLFSRQGKLRLQKWYVPLSDKEKKKITRELVQTVLARKPKMCSFLEWRDLKIVYKRYASLYFCCAIEDQDNELITLEIIHRYVELLDKYFGSVCELDIIFNFEKAYFILDEFLLGGEVQETSKKNVLKAIEQADLLQEVNFSFTRISQILFNPCIITGAYLFLQRSSAEQFGYFTVNIDVYVQWKFQQSGQKICW
ncbi:AP-1 complex subunit sigma-2 isoform X1 [Chrysemys picta bellii]|uniref:AP-1 complex subunit sigma-2 isoform X1 n=1 Tax=Chrysemys picta bellii TaxID=8478 RepID=UPI001C6779C9|nr:AP-1 complex subunit sigma-2 isoform X1 [Chrysemys picta bellii]